MRDVAVVIGSYQSANDLPACLGSLRTQTHAPAEVVVVDAGSADGSAGVARSLGARVEVVENRGLGHLYNAGARTSSADLLLVANADVAFDERCIEELARALEAAPRRWAADPQQLDWSGERVIHARTLLRPGTHGDPIPWLELDAMVETSEPAYTLFANAGAMLVDRGRLLELGGFDETFFIDYEDLDLCWRAWLRGWESVYVPAAVVRHRVGASTGETAIGRRRLISSHHNILRFALKCLPPGPAARTVAGELLRAMLHPRTVGPAFGRIAGELGGILAARRSLRPSVELYRWQLGGQAGPPP